MGANAATSVPGYVSGEVLTAARLNVTNSGAPVFADSSARDAAFGGTGEKTLAEGQLCYLEDSNVVQYYDGSSWATVGPTAAVGLTFISANTFSGVSSFSLPADTFTTTYDNYRLEIQITALSGTGTVRLRTSGSDNSNSSYKYSVGFAGTYTSGSFSAASSATATSFELFMEDAASPYSWQGSMDLMSPRLSDRTVFHGSCANLTKGRLYTGIFDDTTTFDSLSILATSISGTVRVYGYANS